MPTTSKRRKRITPAAPAAWQTPAAIADAIRRLTEEEEERERRRRKTFLFASHFGMGASKLRELFARESLDRMVRDHILNKMRALEDIAYTSGVPPTLFGYPIVKLNERIEFGQRTIGISPTGRRIVAPVLFNEPRAVFHPAHIRVDHTFGERPIVSYDIETAGIERRIFEHYTGITPHPDAIGYRVISAPFNHPNCRCTTMITNEKKEKPRSVETLAKLLRKAKREEQIATAEEIATQRKLTDARTRKYEAEGTVRALRAELEAATEPAPAK